MNLYHLDAINLKAKPCSRLKGVRAPCNDAEWLVISSTPDGTEKGHTHQIGTQGETEAHQPGSRPLTKPEPNYR